MRPGDPEALARIEGAARVRVIYPPASAEQIAAAEAAIQRHFEELGIRPFDAADAQFALEGELYLYDPDKDLTDDEAAALEAWHSAMRLAWRVISGQDEDVPQALVPTALQLELDMDRDAWVEALGDDAEDDEDERRLDAALAAQGLTPPAD